MHLRVRLATAALAAVTLAGCGSEGGSDEVADPSPSASASPAASEAPSADPQDPAAAALRGDWEIPAEEYVLHLNEDGTFIEDYMGVKDFLVGKYNVDGETIFLVGDDGNTSEGTVVDETLELPLGTATRVE